MTNDGGGLGVCFTHEDIDAFARASGDFNPLHLSDNYAVNTAFGGRVVHGVLGCLACFAAVQPRPGHRLARITVAFHEAMVVGVRYRIEVEQDTEESAVIRLFDGQRWLLMVRARFAKGREPDDAAVVPVGREAEAPTDLSPDDLAAGVEVEGAYGCAPEALQVLERRFAVRDRGVGTGALSALLCSSYVAGMKVPGLRALYSHLSMQFTGDVAPALRFSARLTRWDPGVNLARIRLELGGGGRPVASGELRVFVRPDAADPLDGANEAPAAWRTALAGRVGLVIGASRGLGAALARSLAAAGCTVFASYRRNAEAAERLQRTAAATGGRVELVQGDGGDEAWCRALRDRLEAEGHGLDVLVCNASPTLRPLWLDPESLDRIEDHVRAGVRLAGAPLATFLPLLSASRGRAVMISSSAVTDLPPSWPHYVAAKQAVEGLTRVAAREFPEVRFLIARPPRLATDFASSPAGQHLALHPAVAAATIIDAACAVGEGDDVPIVAEFANPTG